MKEYSGYSVEDVSSMLRRHGITWDGKHSDYIMTDDGLKYSEVDATIATLKNGYLNEHISDKRFGWLEVTSHTFNLKFQGNYYDFGEEWMSYLSHKYEDYLPYMKQYLDDCLGNLKNKLSAQKDENSVISATLREQIEEAESISSIVDRLKDKELND